MWTQSTSRLFRPAADALRFNVSRAPRSGMFQGRVRRMKSAWFLVWLAAACSPAQAPVTTTAGGHAPAGNPVTLSIVGTNDLHGQLERLPLFAGFVANLRAARAADGGGGVLVDGGDMVQGTLEANVAEGADVVRAYNQRAYAGVGVGTHESASGPGGRAVPPASPADDPRGALKARAREAKFPFVVSNIVDSATGARVAWPNFVGSTLIEAAGIK